ncbi:MAG: NADH-quinone oxidoreductase subunit B family protein [Vulcanimicrobiaceae bacterium]
MSWFLLGIRSGIRTERYAANAPAPAGATPGFPHETRFETTDDAAGNQARCPTGAIHAQGDVATVNRDRCIHCMRCASCDGSAAMEWKVDYHWAHGTDGVGTLPAAFHGSLHVRVIDAGDCGACLNEIAHLSDPFYNAHRHGIFITPTPRHADVLLVVGPVTQQMRAELATAYEAMPEPKRVVAIGACAVNGGIFGPSVMCAAGASSVVPVDIFVPGCPPPPLAIVHALLGVCESKPLER